MKLSRHSKQRISERTSVRDKAGQRDMFKNALRYGDNVTTIKDEKLREYIKAREHNCKIKVYKGFVFIHSKNAKTLYTMYELPEEFRKVKNEKK